MLRLYVLSEDRRNDFDLCLEPHFGITCSWLFEKAGKRRASMKMGRTGTLSKHKVVDSRSVTWKCKFALLQSFFNYSKSLRLINWNQCFRKWNISQHTLTSSTQLQSRLFHVVKRTRTSAECEKMKNARAKRAKLLFFIFKLNMQICDVLVAVVVVVA